MNDLTPGKQTSEFKLTAASTLINAILMLLVGYGLLTQEQSGLWASVFMAGAVFVLPLATALMTKEYTRGRTALKLEAGSQAVINPTFDLADFEPGAASQRPEAAE